jgi:hypothetical protein
MMKHHVAFGLTMAAALAGTPVLAQHTAGNTTNSTTNPQIVQTFFNTLAGEWDGQVSTRDGGKTSSSKINASNRVENNCEQFASCFQGFSFGKPFQGGSVLTTQNGKFTFASTDTLNTEPARGSFKATAHGFVYSFERTDAKTGKPVKFEQVTTIVNNDNYTVECWSFDSNGKKREFMTMDMNRLPSGQKSEAAATFTVSPALAKARQTLANTTQATADDSN